MCLIAIQFYGSCGHNSRGHPDRCIDLVDTYCPTRLGTLCPTRTETEEHHAGAKCERCSGSHPKGHWTLGQYYKYCEQSRICDHEYGHLVTDLERLDHEPDVVLVTPTDVLCPDCQTSRFDSRPSDMTFDARTSFDTRFDPVSTKSAMPPDFEGLPRISVCDFEEERHVKKVSIVPNATVRPSEKTVFSRTVAGTYDPRASRAPIGTTRTPTTMRYKPGSEKPAPLYPNSPSSSWLRDHTPKPIPTQPSKRTTPATQPERRTSCSRDAENETYTRAPSADAESMDLSSLLGKLSMAPLPSTSRGLEPGALRARSSVDRTRSRGHRYREDRG